MELSHPEHFLHDVNAMDAEQRAARGKDLIAWCKRYADGDANPKWAKFHLFELSRLLEIQTGDNS